MLWNWLEVLISLMFRRLKPTKLIELREARNTIFKIFVNTQIILYIMN